MRILWISPGFPYHESESENLPPLQSLAQSLTATGLELHILTLGYPFFSAPYYWHGIPIKSGYGWNMKWFRWINWFRVFRSAVRLHTDKNFDIIHSFWLGPSWLIGKVLSKKLSIPHLTTLMGQDVLKSNKYHYFFAATKMNPLIAVSEYQAQVFKTSTGLLPTKVIEWGLHKNDYCQKRDYVKNIDILGCGSLIPLKNWTRWINIVSEIIDKHGSIKAAIIGDGPGKNNLQDYIRSKGKTDNIYLLGSLPRPEVLDTMARSKVFLHTSQYESYGYVLLESYVMGCKVVSTPVGIAGKFGQCASREAELCNLVIKNLQIEYTSQPLDIPDMQETAMSYINLYRSMKEVP